MKNWNKDRRDFLKLLASLPVMYFVGCKTLRKDSGTGELPDPDESVRRLVRVLGPWKEREQAEDFIRRFLSARGAIAPYLADGGRSLQHLAARFPAEDLSVDSVDIGVLGEDERKLLLELNRQLYSFIEVRFLVAGEPPWGVCNAGDPLRYTRVPA